MAKAGRYVDDICMPPVSLGSNARFCCQKRLTESNNKTKTESLYKYSECVGDVCAVVAM